MRKAEFLEEIKHSELTLTKDEQGYLDIYFLYSESRSPIEIHHAILYSIGELIYTTIVEQLNVSSELSQRQNEIKSFDKRMAYSIAVRKELTEFIEVNAK